MKKIFCLFIVLLLVTGCNESGVNYTYDIKSSEVDMSGYEGVNSVNHNFRKITIDQLFNCVDEKSSGVFIMGMENCGCCQISVRYLNQAAQELGVTVYYIDVYDMSMPLIGDDCQECVVRRDRLKEILNRILTVGEDGEKKLETPTVFSIVNGEVKDYLICHGNLSWDAVPTESQVNKLVNKYKEILKPFAQ